MAVVRDAQEVQMLIEARARAQQMLDELVRRQAEIEAAAADLSEEQLAEGRAAFQKATESARRVVENLIAPVQ